MINKSKLVLGIATATFTMAAVMVSPQAAALTKAERIAAAANNKVDALEAQLQAMQAELASLRAEASRPRMDADSEKVQELDQWMASVKSAPVKEDHHDNTIFFRGGFARNDVKRNDLLTGNQFAGNALGGGRTNKDGWYVGAGFDFSLTDDVWGAMDDTQVLAELMFEYKNFGAKNFKGAAPGAAPGTVGANPACTLINLAAVDTAGAPGLAGTANCNGVTVSQFTLTAAPKIKFMKGSAFRPWIIPIGLGVHVISPPSNGVTVLNPGMMFGAGADYKLWKDIYIGTDVRYHLTGRSVDGVNTDGLTAGGYLGLGF
ncbi:MAG: porin family protein [Methylobacter sp.]|nr:porin family protein [Methylobacter sp.]